MKARGRLWKALGPLQMPVIRTKRWIDGLATHKLSRDPALFDDRSRGSGTLLIVLAGHKPDLWPMVFPRIVAHTSDADVDICVVCSGGAPAGSEARKTAEQHGWSFLQAEEDLLAHAQNLAVAAFPKASWIAKLDEDMFVTAGWLQELHEVYERAAADGQYRIGFVAPTIPVNGFGYKLFLDLTGSVEEYRTAFPEHPPVSAGLDNGACTDSAVAEWLWRRSSPLDATAARLSEHAGAYSICPHRFSIGAFLMHRGTFSAFDGFAVAKWPGTLGHEEQQLCLWCMDQSHAIVIAHASVVGHFAFGPQWTHMNTVLQREPALFD